MRIDLHTHSNLSDGTDAPGEVVRQAAQAGLDVVALTDHDTCDGWDEAQSAALDVGVEFVPGIEISCNHAGISIHLLGYWMDMSRGPMADLLEAVRSARRVRARAIVDKLAEHFPLTWDAVAQRSADATTVGRPHIADALVEAGVVPDRSEAFERILSAGSPYYVPYWAPQVLDALGAVRGAGGVAVFAHPAASSRGAVVDDAVIRSMAQAGLAGLEIDHRDHTQDQREALEKIRHELDLVRTGSSDFHGSGKPNRLGENLTSEESYARLRALAQP